MKRINTVIMVGICLALLLPAAWAAPTHTPKPGSKERRAIMDALRPPVMKWYRGEGYSGKVIFEVFHLKVSGGWAYFSGSGLQANGSRFERDDLCGGIDALLRQKGKRWQVLHWGIASDVSVGPEIKRKYPQAPHSIFPNWGSGQ